MKTTCVLILVLLFTNCKNTAKPLNPEVQSIEYIKNELSSDLIKINEESFKSDPFDGIDIIDIDCNKVDSLLSKALETDQNSRKGIDTGIVDVDGHNQNTVVSILEKCGWPKSKKSITTVWVVLQHSNYKLMSNYYPKFKEFEKSGLIEEGTMALMEDRILMSNGLPQIYGSQVLGGKLHDLKYPERLDELRNSVKLEPIEDYTNRFGFEFDIEDYKNKKE